LVIQRLHADVAELDQHGFAVFSLDGRLRRFLEYVVEKSLGGEENQLKEYTIGLAVFDRGADFDPRIDPIVRVEAGRLRHKLQRSGIRRQSASSATMRRTGCSRAPCANPGAFDLRGNLARMQ